MNCSKNNFSSRKSNFFEISSTFFLVNSKFHISKFIFEILCLDPAVLVKSHEKIPKIIFEHFLLHRILLLRVFRPTVHSSVRNQFTVTVRTCVQFSSKSSVQFNKSSQFKFSQSESSQFSSVQFSSVQSRITRFYSNNPACDCGITVCIRSTLQL